MMRGPMATGFTLIELMIAVAVVGILAAIAYPSYQDQIRKSRRTDATTSLLNAAQALERCYTAFSAYDYVDPDDPSIKCTVPVISQEGHYDIAWTDKAATTYTLTATPAAGDPQASDTTCAKFSLTHTGLRQAENDSASNTTADCWPR